MDQSGNRAGERCLDSGHSLKVERQNLLEGHCGDVRERKRGVRDEPKVQGLATRRMELSFTKSNAGTGRKLGIPDYQVSLVIQLEMSNRQLSAEVRSSERGTSWGYKLVFEARRPW